MYVTRAFGVVLGSCSSPVWHDPHLQIDRLQCSIQFPGMIFNVVEIQDQTASQRARGHETLSLAQPDLLLLDSDDVDSIRLTELKCGLNFYQHDFASVLFNKKFLDRAIDIPFLQMTVPKIIGDSKFRPNIPFALDCAASRCDCLSSAITKHGIRFEFIIQETLCHLFLCHPLSQDQSRNILESSFDRSRLRSILNYVCISTYRNS